jgi:manganese efflux pump family protein
MNASGAAWAVVLVACSLALDVFAVCVGVGMRGANAWLKVRIGIAFASAEVVMVIVGAGLGAVLGHAIGPVAGYLGYAALVGIGAYMIVESARERKLGLDLSKGWGLFLASLSISLDSLGIGFSILTIGAPMPVSLLAIAIASVTATTCGLAFGRALGERVESAAEVWAGVVLILTGLAFAVLRYFGI